MGQVDIDYIGSIPPLGSLCLDNAKVLRYNRYMFKTRQQLTEEGLLNIPPHSVYSEAMIAIAKDKMDSVSLFHSDVYYVRAALEKHTGFVIPLPKVEKAMRAEGWNKK